MAHDRIRSPLYSFIYATVRAAAPPSRLRKTNPELSQPDLAMPFARFLSFLLLASPALAGLLPPTSPYVVTNGVVTGEAENYHARATGNGDQWLEAPTNAIVPTGVTFENANGGLFMQAQPDNGPGSVPFSGAGSGPSIDYSVQFTVPGTYRLYLRWDGHDGSSDSIYAGIVELADGIGGTHADRYEDVSHTPSHLGPEGRGGVGGVV